MVGHRSNGRENDKEVWWRIWLSGMKIAAQTCRQGLGTVAESELY